MLYPRLKTADVTSNPPIPVIIGTIANLPSDRKHATKRGRTTWYSTLKPIGQTYNNLITFAMAIVAGTVTKNSNRMFARLLKPK